MDLRTFLIGAALFCSAVVVIALSAPEFLKNDPSAASAKPERVAKSEPLVEAPMDENDSDNEERAEEPSIDDAEAADNPFGEDQ
jgi:hypothetical protein